MPLSLSDFEREALPALLEYCSIECLSPGFDDDWIENGHIDAAIEMLAAWSRERQFADANVEVIRIEGRTPVLLVTVEATNTDDATIVLYGHLDKQPPLGDWSEGLSPFQPVRRDDRLYARGVADDGYSTFSALLALEQLEIQGLAHSRCVVLIEASEESGSSDLDAYLDHLVEKLGRVELMICLDSSALTYDRLWVTTSLRGVVHVEVTVQVLTQGRHSGLDGGVVPSSFRILRQLLERLEDSTTGRVILPELHAEIPREARESAQALAEEFGAADTADIPVVSGLTLMGENDAERILNRTWRPALAVIGMGGIPAPEIAGNVLRPFTTASLSFRLPPSVDAQSAGEALERALSADVPHGALVSVRTQSADGWAAPPSAPWLRDALESASRRAFGHEPGYYGGGGTIPFLASLARRYPSVQFVATGVLGPDSNAHGIDEMLDLPTAVAITNVVSDVVVAFGHRHEQS